MGIVICPSNCAMQPYIAKILWVVSQLLPFNDNRLEFLDIVMLVRSPSLYPTQHLKKINQRYELY